MLVGESPPAKSQSVSVWKQDNPSGDNTIQQGGEAQDLEFEVPLGYIVSLRAAWATCRDPFLGKKNRAVYPKPTAQTFRLCF